MKQGLEFVYRELAAGRLSQPEALSRIRALQRAGQEPDDATLLAAPQWRLAELTPAPAQAADTQWWVLLYGIEAATAQALAPALAPAEVRVLARPAQAAPGEAYAQLALEVFAAVREALRSKPQTPVRVQLAVAGQDGDEWAAGLAGLFETAQLENPQISGQVVFVPADACVESLTPLLRGERKRPRDLLVRHDARGRWLRGWSVLEPAAQAAREPFKEDGVYLITGGLGGLGRLFAQDILGRTTRAKVVLAGRREADEAARGQLRALHAGDDGRLAYRAFDVAGAAQVERAVADIVAEHGRLDGIVHSAGVLRDDFIIKKEAPAFAEVLAAKVAGSANLDRASRALDLDFLLLFSSIASWAGNLGQADYAAANGFMERFAEHRNAQVAAGERRGRTLAIAWPHWRDGGMHVDAGSMAALERRTGLRSMHTAAGMQALYLALAGDSAHVLALHGDAAAIRRALDGDTAAAPAPVANAAPAAAGAAPVEDLPARVREFLRGEFAAVLKLPAERIEARAPLEKYGIDSILAMSLTDRLEASFGALPKTLFFEYLSIEELAQYFLRSHAAALAGLFAESAPAPAAAAAQAPGVALAPAAPQPAASRRRQRFAAPTAASAPAPAANEPIAIVGLSGRYPEARDLHAYWTNLREGRDCIVEVPASRWNWREHYSDDRTREGAHYSKWGGFIEGVDEFDPRFFNISPREARSIDPQERLFLQHAWMAIEDAGYTRASLQIPHDGRPDGQVGVYAGVMYGEYNLSGSLASIANRVSYVLNLHGPSLTLDTMCSSSLTALHLACQDLRSGRTSLALAGGVNVSIHPNKYAMLSGGQFISGDGHCQSFGEGGDGYIPGEGVGVAVLKRLADAQREGNHIYAVIRGSALNHGGKTNGYTVPNPQAQADAIRQALAEAGIDPRDVSYIEAHGTGTKLGDPIEIAALTKAFHDGLPAPQRATGYCRIGSAKSNIGHCESAAGIAGVSKVLLQMKHGAIAPSLHSARLNPHIDFAATPFVVNQRLSPWQAPSRDGRTLPRIAGVSSFGAGGSNAHVVIEEYAAPARPPRAAAAMLVPLSARTAEQLAQRVADLLAWIERGERFEPADLAFTLQVGRESMEERVAFVAETPERLCDQLRAVLSGGSLPAGAHRGQVKPHRDLLDVDCGPIDAWLSQARLEELAQAWVKGAAPQWRQLYPAAAMPRLMSLPTYPFARERYWVAPLASQPVAATAVATLHPLVHANTSGLDGLGYASAFGGDEAFLGGASAELPPLLALEMVRFAAANARAASAGVWEISGLAWDEPMSVGEGRGLRVAVYPVAEDAVDIEIRADDDSGGAVHAQAHAAWVGDDALASLDAAQLRSNLQRIDGALPAGIAEAFAGQGEWLLRWSPSAPQAAAVALPPGLLAALSAWLRDAFGAVQFETLARARVLRACGGEAWIQIRRAAADSVDIEVCDTQGAVCAQLHGLRYRTLAAAAAPVASLPAAAASPAIAPAAAIVPVPAPAPVTVAPREIDLGVAPSREASAAPAMPPARGKPTGIVLAASVEVPRAPAAAKGKVVLSHAAVADAGAPVAAGDVRLFDLGEGVLRLEWSGRDLAAQAGALAHALRRAAQEPSIKALVLSGASAQAWRGDRAACNAAVAQHLFAALAAFPYPVVAALPTQATGAGWLLGAVCDFMLLAGQGRYGFTDAERGLLPDAHEDALVRERLGERLADDFLYAGREFSGAELRRRGWSCRIVDAAQVASDAEALAMELARKPQLALRLLKAHLAERTIALAEALAEVAPPAAQLPREAGLVELDPDAAGGAEALAQTLADAIELAGAGHSALVVSIAARAAWSAVAAETAQSLAQALSASCVPLIAAFEGPADGVDALLGLCCDAAVYRDDAAYGVAGLTFDPELDRQAAVLAELRFGPALARDLCLSAQARSGAELQARCATLIAAGHGETVAAAQALAGAWSRWPQAQLSDWAQARRARVRAALEAAPRWSTEQTEASSAPPAAPTPIALRSAVVTATAHPDGVVLIELHDRDAKNMFSPALVDGLKQAFDYVAATPSCKAVVLSGYDSYFATGGTRDTLLAIQQGQARFTDETVFQSPMDCPLPVIAALQGHAIGGGWSFGMFADLALFAEESRYLSPYMGYGFTPGAGSTLMFPRQLGHDLARESLLTAQELSGRALRERALAWPVLPRRELVAAALAQASAIARQPRARLQALKRVWTQAPQAAREAMYRREVAMHERTFVGDAETLQRIQSQFAAPQEAAPAPAAAAPAGDAPVLEQIRQMLAQELFLQAEEIDDDAQFIDLGLDSITGVTWIRRINAHYGIEIEATKVYSLPTLTRLGRHIAEVAGQGAQAAPAAVAPAVAAPAPVAVAAATFSASDDGAGLAEVAAVLRDLLARELHLQAQEIDDATQFIDLGLDSITGVTWVRKINERYRLDVEATKVYSHSTLAAMARLVREGAVRAGSLSAPTVPAPALSAVAAAQQAAAPDAAPVPLRERAKLASWRHRAAAPMRASTSASASATAAPAPASAQAFEPIAVIGMAGRFPKAPDLETFWQNLVEGRDCIDEVPESRWRLRDYYQAGAPAPGRTNSRWLGAMEDADRFDPLFFNISPTEAECMDPQQRVFLQASWHCLENAGYDPQALSGKQCGVFVGCGPSDYLQAAGERRLSAQGFTGAATSILAARIAYFLNLRGPCVSIDTACSSSLVAIANACDSLNAGHSDLALAGGVYVMAGPSMHVMTAQAGMLSADGRCHTFDQDANGFVPGEAVGVLMLKRLRDAERDGDRIDAVIQGWGVNQDGKTNGITAPNEDAQSELLRSVYRRFGIDPAGIGLVEAHGTGTKLGDPIEIAGLKAAFAPFTQAENFCALGSVKSNIGHCLTGAGAAGVIKLALALRHRQRPPTIHFRKRNEHIQLDGSPFYVNDRLGEWPAPAGGERRGAISSFGFSGTNAHLVLGEYLAPPRAEAVAMRAPDGRIAVPLSARNEERLREQAQQLLDFLRRHPRTDLTELAYTLQSGREAMGERLGLLAASTEELAARLEAFLAGDSAQDGVYVGQVKRHREGMRLIGQDPEVRALIVEKWLGQRRLGKLLELWSKGLELDWNLMYGADKPRRIALPGYPFARQRYWIEAEAAADTAPQDAPHPLLHRNVSLLSGQRYRSDFRGDEFFFQPDVDGRPVVATGALLEMARGAVAAASTDQPAAPAVELRGLSLSAAATAGELAVELAANERGGIDWRICGADPAASAHAEGEAWLVAPEDDDRIDVAALRARCADPHALNEEQAYARLADAGWRPGAALRGLRRFERGDAEALAQLAVPACARERQDGYGLPPSLLEAALHAAALFADGAPMQPLALESIASNGGGESELSAWVRYAEAGAETPRLDIDLFDAEGRVHARLRGLELAQAEQRAALSIATPVWDRVDDRGAPARVAANERVLVVGAEPAQADALRRHYADAALSFVDSDAEASETFAGSFRDAAFDRLLWVVNAQAAPQLSEESIVADQERGLMRMLRIARGLAAAGLEQRPLHWDVVSLNALAPRRGDLAEPVHAGLQGLCGSMAEAYPHWTLRLLDLPALSAAALGALRALPARSSGTCLAWRDGEWFAQSLIGVRGLDAAAVSPYRSQGVYVVIGGAGGIGELWTRHVIEQCQANVIWIGRRPLDASIRAKLEAMRALGKAPEYIQADASSREQLRAAYERIKRDHPAIHGVIHSAVGAFDQSLKSVGEADFRAILSVKIDASVRIAQVFAGEALDFAAFFSSNAAFVRGAGMAGYSAGCTFKDAYAQRLDRKWPCAVKVVNWGYWSVGAGEALTDAMKTYFQQTGHRPLAPEEGMRALDAFLASDLRQVSIAKSTRPGAQEWTTQYPPAAAAQAEALAAVRVPAAAAAATAAGKAGAQMEPLLRRWLRAIVDTTAAPAPAYARWLAESRKLAASFGLEGGEDPAQLRREWDAAMALWLRDAGRSELCRLVDRCIGALPQILSGQRKATDVLFPESSLTLVENVYKTDVTSLAYNGALRDSLVAAVRARLAAEPGARLRLLEIGAGTGATTVGLLQALNEHREHIAEYCYTDISRAFLLHAQEVYAPDAPYLRTQLFNAELPLAGQGIDAGAYDFVIAANVIHATGNIRNTLRNAKAVLRAGGALLMNEISEHSLCGHLTFGLLDGWWLNEDEAVRIPGSPGLYPAAWQRVLEEEGFGPVAFPCADAHAAGQQIVLAVSDGAVRQRSPAAPVAAPAAASAPRVARTAAPLAVVAAPQADAAPDLRGKTAQLCRQLIGAALKIEPAQIDPAEPLESYGIDSIVIGLVNQKLQQHFDDIGATLLYEHRTVDALAGHLLRTQEARLRQMFGAQLAAEPAQAPAASLVPAAAIQPQAQDEDALREQTLRLCTRLFADALKLDAAQIDPAEPLERYGIDSIIVGTVNQQLQQRFGDIGSTVLFQCRSVEALVQHLLDHQREALQRMFRVAAPAARAVAFAAPVRRAPQRIGLRSPAPAHAAPRDARPQPIAVIGLSGTYPQAGNLDEFWQNLKSGRDSVGEIPARRWSLDGFYEADEQRAVEASKSYCKWGGFVDQFAQFDSLFFGIPPREALNMDPQERMFLQAAWGALEDAGYTRAALRERYGRKVGVFAGITRAGYNLYRTTHGRQQDKFWPRTSFGSVANRLSYFLDINGPSLPVDTMCSSSLTAIHEACEHIHNGDCELAFAGGVNLYLHPTSYVDMSSQHMLSPDGRCKSFGAGGNGFVPGEGVGVVLLKRLDRAIADGDCVHGVILATHVNHGGKTNGFTVPNPTAQAELVRRALDKAGLDAREVSYIEAHGTGTELGDPIEVAGLQQAFAQDSQDTGYCKLGSAKSNIGHLEAAAGIAGLTKVLLQLRHGQIAPTLHAATTNPHIAFAKTAFEVNQTLVPWQRPRVDGRERPRIAGISSFGAGGANAHVIVQEFVAPAAAAYAHSGPYLVPLSARTPEQLQQKASDLLDFLQGQGAHADLAAIAYSLQTGREAMEERLGWVVDSAEQLAARLSACVYGESGEGAHRGQAQRNSPGLGLFVQDDELREAIDKWIARGKYDRLLELWVKGLELDWNRLYGAQRPRRVALPTYPFARDEYWIDSVEAAAPVRAAEPAAGGEVADIDRIEQVIGMIDTAAIDAREGVELLKRLV